MHVETRKTIRKDSSKRQPMRKKEVKKFEKFEAELMSPNEKKNVSWWWDEVKIQLFMNFPS
jgi:hypothetical protein